MLGMGQILAAGEVGKTERIEPRQQINEFMWRQRDTEKGGVGK